MIGRLLWNDIRNHKLLSLSTLLFMAASSLFISLAAVVFSGLLGSVDGYCICWTDSFGENCDWRMITMSRLRNVRKRSING